MKYREYFFFIVTPFENTLFTSQASQHKKCQKEFEVEVSIMSEGLTVKKRSGRK
jgi:hypothetical protein